jgi:hypothetical protein
MTDKDRPKSPSGAPVIAYGEFLTKVWFTGTEQVLRGEVQVEAPPNLPLPFITLACEHLMMFIAKNSGDGLERTLEKLTKGALEAATTSKKVK